MAGLGSVGLLSSDQLRALNRIAQLSQAISVNQLRLSTLKRIDSAADDPAGLVQATLLQQQLSAAETAADNVTRASALLNTADTASGEILTQLNNARTLALQAAGGTLSAAEVAGNQIQLDTILASIDNLARTQFNGKQLLTGASGFTVTGVNTAKVDAVRVTDKTTANDATISVNVTTTATRATDTYTGGVVAADVTLVVEGKQGTSTVSLQSGASLQDVADAFNAVTYETGVTAVVNGSNVDFTSTDYGSSAKITIEPTQGTFTLTTTGTVTGTDAVATINGAQVTGDGSTFTVHAADVSLVVMLNPTASGAIAPFTVSGPGLVFNVGASPASTARIGLPSLLTADLGSVDGRLSSIGSGGGNSLIDGNAARTLRIIDGAIADVTRSRAIIGGFQEYTLGSASRVLAAQKENESAALSNIQDANVAFETAQLTSNKLMQQLALESLSIASQRSQDVLSLLKSVAGLS